LLPVQVIGFSLPRPAPSAEEGIAGTRRFQGKARDTATKSEYRGQPANAWGLARLAAADVYKPALRTAEEIKTTHRGEPCAIRGHQRALHAAQLAELCALAVAIRKILQKTVKLGTGTSTSVTTVKRRSAKPRAD